MTMMKAMVHERYGAADDVLAPQEVDRPTAGDDDVIVRVRAAGVDPGVWHVVAGLPYAIRLGTGLRRPRGGVPGMGVAGVVDAVGRNVTGFRPGDEVYGVCGGSYAEYAKARPDKLAPKPANLTMEQAAAVPISANTALQAVRDVAHVQKGQTVLVIGAGGGIGTFAVQLAKAFGAHVTGVCGPTKTDLVRSLGADDVIDHSRDDVLAQPGRYDVIIDTVGNLPVPRLRRVLAAHGTLVVVGDVESGRWLGMGRTLRAVTLSPFVGQKLRALISVTRGKDLQFLRELIEAGQVTPLIDRTYALSDAADAIGYLMSGKARGKVVLTV